MRLAIVHPDASQRYAELAHSIGVRDISTYDDSVTAIACLRRHQSIESLAAMLVYYKLEHIRGVEFIDQARKLLTSPLLPAGILLDTSEQAARFHADSIRAFAETATDIRSQLEGFFRMAHLID